MAGFANALSERSASYVSKELFWLAGLLEAEGTFLHPPPSMPNCPIVSCRMTDRDVVERVAAMFGTKVVGIDKGQYRTEYAATLKGSGAVTFMTDIRPLMGRRRQGAIDTAIRCYRPPKRKLAFSDAEKIRRRFSNGESESSLARLPQRGPSDNSSDTAAPHLSRAILDAVANSDCHTPERIFSTRDLIHGALLASRMA